jgi:hypothetical protein
VQRTARQLDDQAWLRIAADLSALEATMVAQATGTRLDATFEQLARHWLEPARHPDWSADYAKKVRSVATNWLLADAITIATPHRGGRSPVVPLSQMRLGDLTAAIVIEALDHVRTQRAHGTYRTACECATAIVRDLAALHAQVTEGDRSAAGAVPTGTVNGGLRPGARGHRRCHRGADQPLPGVTSRATIHVTDTETGLPITDVTRSHEAWMHVIVTRDDLDSFAHLHPEPTGRPGEFRVDIAFPTVGRYLVHTELRRQGQMTDVLDRREVVVHDVTRDPVRLMSGPRKETSHRVAVELQGDAVVGGESRFTFRFTDPATGQPLTGLQPYYSAAGHIIVMSEDTTTFAHGHAEAEDDRGRPVFALPGQTFGPELDFHFRFRDPGLYRLWGQFRLPDGGVITVPFTVEAT